MKMIHPVHLFLGAQEQIHQNSHDQIIFTYSIDGGPEVQSLYAHGTSASDFTGTYVGPLNGNTLNIKIYAANKASAEIFYFHNLLVTGTSILSAGPDKSGCVGYLSI